VAWDEPLLSELMREGWRQGGVLRAWAMASAAGMKTAELRRARLVIVSQYGSIQGRWVVGSGGDRRRMMKGCRHLVTGLSAPRVCKLEHPQSNRYIGPPILFLTFDCCKIRTWNFLIGSASQSFLRRCKKLKFRHFIMKINRFKSLLKDKKIEIFANLGY